MAKVRKVQQSNSQRLRVTASSKNVVKGGLKKRKCSKAPEKKDLQGATCPVCLEFPHNAVLLLCSSYHKGCRPYMCATGSRFSNCLEQYKKAYTKVNNGLAENSRLTLGADELDEVPELLCPLCRGQVKGWTVVEQSRKYFNRKRRACMQEKCSFVGTYRELKKHVKTKHPLARPRAVDPILEEKWKKLEHERERDDVISTIVSSTPGALVLGDYVIEPGYQGGIYGDDSDDYDSDDSIDEEFFNLESLGGGQNRRIGFFDSFDGEEFDMNRILRADRPPVQRVGYIGRRTLVRVRGRSRGR